MGTAQVVQRNPDEYYQYNANNLDKSKNQSNVHKLASRYQNGDVAEKTISKMMFDLYKNPQKYSTNGQHWQKIFDKLKAEAKSNGDTHDDAWWKQKQDEAYWATRNDADGENAAATFAGLLGRDNVTMDELFADYDKQQKEDQARQEALAMANEAQTAAQDKQKKEQEEKEQQTRPEDYIRRRYNENLDKRNPNQPVIGTQTIAAKGPEDAWRDYRNRNMAPVKPAAPPSTPVVTAK